ncbi:MAG: TRAP transporter small permease [Spirochaetaceae bacterium]|nr:TRAP transporter small permease [Spirochaetaceae bacterium]
MSGSSIHVCKSVCVRIQKGINSFLMLLMVVMAVVMFSQVLLRACFGKAFTWAEELLRFMYIWVVFLGLPTGVYYNDLTRFDLLQTKLKGIAGKLLETGIYLLINAILFILVWGSFTLIERQFRQQATTLPIPMGVIYLILPTSSIIAVIFVIIRLVMMWTDAPDFEETGDN